MRRVFSTLLWLLLLSAEASTSPFRPGNDRLPEKPSWEIDVTDALTLSTGENFATAMSPSARNGRVKNGALHWSVTLKLPETAQPGWPVVLEGDETRVIQKAILDGKESLSFNRDDRGSFLSSGEGAALLPLGANRPEAILQFTSLENPAVYTNGFGRLRLRPATVDEFLVIERTNPSSERVRLVNRSAFPMEGVLQILQEDYFGVPLGTTREEFKLREQGSQEIVLPHASDPAILYKTRLWTELQGRRSFEYWRIMDVGRDRRERKETLRLVGPWSWVFVPEAFENNPPPKQGWKTAATLPIVPKGEEYSSHWMWTKTRFTIPADWPAGRRAYLQLSMDIHHHARILIDGKLIGEAANWELPKAFPLPPDLQPGTEHELYLGITDYIVGLAPGITPPAKGALPSPARGIAAPMGPIAHTRDPLQIKLDTVPELLWMPISHVQEVKLRTFTGQMPKLEAEVYSQATEPVAVHSEVFYRGKSLLNLGTQTSNGTDPIRFSKEWSNPILWSPETPDLLELRTTLTDGSGNVLDVHRQRFGFREFGTSGNKFTLNGNPIHLLGGSHVNIAGMTWPVRSHPFRLIRHGINGSLGFTAGCPNGVQGLDAGDEMGYLLKSANSNVCAYVADLYAWHIPETWERFTQSWKQTVQAYRNRPSVVLWDVGNEISFKGEGEAARMGKLLQHIDELDPTRIATVGGSYPFAQPTRIVNLHGWGDWKTRADYFFARPEERPSYLKKNGYYSVRPDNEPKEEWHIALKEPGSARQLYPGILQELRHVNGLPVLFAESHYYESQLPLPLLGHDAYLSLPTVPNAPHATRWSAFHALNMLATRSISIQNVRQAGAAASLIHVDRGLGRALLPVASFSWDRKTRFFAGDRLQTKFGVHYDLTHPGRATATYRLFDGATLLDEKLDSRQYLPGDVKFVELDFPLSAHLAGRELRIEIRVTPEKGGGEFYDHLPISVYSPVRLTLPKEQKLAVFDPEGDISAALHKGGLHFTPLPDLPNWTPEPNLTLLIGSEGLKEVSKPTLAVLQKKIANGGRLIVLDHFALPSFLSARLNQTSLTHNYAAVMEGFSPITDGLTTEDFRAWNTQEKDQVVSWNPLEQPSAGAFRTHITVGRAAPVLEVAEGKGRVLFVQLNFRNALGLEPAAARVLANLLKWTGTDSPFQAKSALIVGAPGPFLNGLKNRVGFTAKESQSPTQAEISESTLILAEGNQPSTRDALETVKATLKDRLESGASLFFYGLDASGAEWLSKWLGHSVAVRPFAHRYAYLTHADSAVTRGLGHGDFFVEGLSEPFDLATPLAADEGPRTGLFEVTGPNVLPLTRPAYLSEIRVGKGKIVICQVSALQWPMPSQLRVLSQVLLNLGAKLDVEGGQKSETRWKSHPIDLSPFVNRSVVDSDTPGEARGWNASGADNDLRELPTGLQTFHGIQYRLEADQRGARFIALRGAQPKFEGLPEEVKGIPVDRKAERLYFLHVSVWGVPEFTYRIYYKEDRAVWIPGKPDPFVDVVVKPGEHIEDWVFAGATARGERFLPGAIAAWVGGNPVIRRTSTTGGKDVGLFQMHWDNPHPEKTIESIDILSPGLAGSGHPFVFAITAANRDSAPLPALKDLLPPGIHSDTVEAQVQFTSYGFVLLKDGRIAAIYDSKGESLFSANGFRLEAWKDRIAQPPEIRILREQKGFPAVAIEAQKEGDKQEFTFTGADDTIRWKQRIVATPARFRLEFEYTPLAPEPEQFKIRLLSGLRFLPSVKPEVKINQNPIPLATQGGSALLSFDSKHTTWVFSYRLSPDGFTLLSPPKHSPDYQIGRAETFWWELSLPLSSHNDF